MSDEARDLIDVGNFPTKEDLTLTPDQVAERIYNDPNTCIYFYGKCATAWRDTSADPTNQATGAFNGFTFKDGERSAARWSVQAWKSDPLQKNR